MILRLLDHPFSADGCLSGFMDTGSGQVPGQVDDGRAWAEEAAGPTPLSLPSHGVSCIVLCSRNFVAGVDQITFLAVRLTCSGYRPKTSPLASCFQDKGGRRELSAERVPRPWEISCWAASRITVQCKP
jgi:hypothetical protein